MLVLWLCGLAGPQGTQRLFFRQRRTIRRSLINFLILGRKIVNNAPVEDDHELTSKDNGQHEARTGRELRRGLACAAAEQRGGSTGSGTHVWGFGWRTPPVAQPVMVDRTGKQTRPGHLAGAQGESVTTPA